MTDIFNFIYHGEDPLAQKLQCKFCGKEVDRGIFSVTAHLKYCPELNEKSNESRNTNSIEADQRAGG